MGEAKGAIVRLQKEYRAILKKETIENYIALPDEKNILLWNFLIFGLKNSDY